MSHHINVLGLTALKKGKNNQMNDKQTHFFE